MSAVRTCITRSLRFNLSTRYQCLQRRAESTASNVSSPTHSTPPSSFFRRNRSTILWTSLFFTLGAVGGQLVVHTIAPPALPDIGTREDEVLLADINRRLDEEFKVKVLRGKCLGVGKALKGEDSGWYEVIPLPIELGEKQNVDDQMMEHMKGAKGMGAERMFWDSGSQKLVAVVWIGGSVCGWPGVTHGGAIATLMGEKLGLAAALAPKGSVGALAAATPQRLPGTGDHAKMFAPSTTPDEPAQLSMGYLKPTYANQFYVIRVEPAIPQEKESELTPEPYGGAEYEATLETPEGKACVKARAKFKPSTAMQRAERKVVGDAKSSYEDFKEWMWPSRQRHSQID